MTTRLATCILSTPDTHDLTPGKSYRVIEDAGAARVRYLRVVDDSGEDYLYPASWFAMSDG